MIQLVIPAYFHPAVHGEDWRLLARNPERVSLVVLNLASGPGTLRDDAFLPVLDELRDAGVPVAGYVDTNYGRRDIDLALAEVERYVDWYGVTGVFFDRAAAGRSELRHYATLAARARALGPRVIAFNHGAHPIEAYAEHADLLGIFEGPWAVYLDATVPRWVRHHPAEQFFHLVYAVPPLSTEDALALAALRHAGSVYLTDQTGANPWQRLSASLLTTPVE